MNVVFEDCLKMNLLMGFIFFITGLITNTFPPKKINYLYGYRTSRSMKNQNNWDIAQRFSTKKMIQGSLVLIAISCSNMLFNLSDTIDLWVGVLSSFGVVAYIFYSTENELKKNELSCQ
jgi:uncharacterized membrane protein